MKITTSRGFETSKALAKPSGQEQREFITWVVDAATQLIQATRNNLNFADNFSFQELTVKVKNGVAQEINTALRQPRYIVVGRSFDSRYHVTSFFWEINSSSRPEVTVGFTGSPGDTAIELTLLVFF